MPGAPLLNKTRKIISWTLGILLVCWLLLIMSTEFIQDKLVFQATKLAPDHVFTFNHRFEEHAIKTKDGETLSALLFPADSASKGLILYFHGNAGNLQRWGEYAPDFTTLGYDILMVDYRGYGKSTGVPDETSLYDDAVEILKWAEGIAHKKLIIYGRSLGSGVACNLAARSNPDLLILETPFYELKDAVSTWLRPFVHLKYEFPNYKLLPQVKCRKVIIQGTKDSVVPYESAVKLKPLLGGQDEFVVVAGGGHNNLSEFSIFHETLRRVLR
jgi:pimeloyl-ACP methyl ester carboxylesterase